MNQNYRELLKEISEKSKELNKLLSLNADVDEKLKYYASLAEKLSKYTNKKPKLYLIKS